MLDMIKLKLGRLAIKTEQTAAYWEKEQLVLGRAQLVSEYYQQEKSNVVTKVISYDSSHKATHGRINLIKSILSLVENHGTIEEITIKFSHDNGHTKPEWKRNPLPIPVPVTPNNFNSERRNSSKQ